MQRPQTVRQQRSRFDIAKVLVALISGAALVVALVAASPTPTGVSGTAASGPSNVYVIPDSINSTCQHDVTYAFGKWLLSVPNGTPGHDSVIKLNSGACYELNGSIWWRGARNIVLDGSGATIKQKSVAIPDRIVGGWDNPKVAPYCGSDANKQDLYSAITSNVLLLSFEGGCNITVENLKIDGMHRGIGTTSKFQPDTFITFYGTQRALVRNVNMVGPYGDYLDVSGLHETAGTSADFPATDITVENCTFADSGREGISETGGAHRVTIEGNTFEGLFESTATVFDIEVDVVYPYPADTDILIAHNAIIGESYAFLLSAQTGAELRRVAFNDNTLTDGAQMRIYIEPHGFGGGVNNNVEVDGNTSEAASTWPNRSPVNVHNMVDVLVMGNTDPPPIYAGKPAGRPFAALANAQHDNLACGNKTSSGSKIHAACLLARPTITRPAPAALPS